MQVQTPDATLQLCTMAESFCRMNKFIGDDDNKVKREISDQECILYSIGIDLKPFNSEK
jgi:hypothetical protein